jgi:hypothetical protein
MTATMLWELGFADQGIFWQMGTLESDNVYALDSSHVPSAAAR